METGTRAPRKTDKRRRKKRSCDEGRGCGDGGVHPNQSSSLPPALAGPTDSCSSRSQLEPSLPPADKRLRLVQHSQHHSISDSGSKG